MGRGIIILFRPHLPAVTARFTVIHRSFPLCLCCIYADQHFIQTVNRVHILKCPGFIPTHPAICNGKVIELRTLLWGPTEQPREVKTNVIPGSPFCTGKQATVKLLLPVRNPGHHRVANKLNRLLRNIRKCGFFQVINHVRRDIKNPCNHRPVQLGHINDLSIHRRNCQSAVIQLRRQQHGFIFLAAKRCHRPLPHIFKPAPALFVQFIFHRNNTGRTGITVKKGAGILLATHSHTNGFSMLHDRAQSHFLIVSQRPDMDHVVRTYRKCTLFVIHPVSMTPTGVK